MTPADTVSAGAEAAPVRPLAWIALGMLVAPVLVHLGIGYDPFPDWSSDPTVMYTPKTTLGPGESITLDLITLAGCVLLVLMRESRPHWLACLLAMVGAMAAVLHSKSPEGVATGAAWTAAITAAVTAGSLRDARLRLACLAALIGCVFLLVSKGAYQVFIEHPRTIQSFRESRETFLASQGWTPGSTMARAFERRLNQAEASGWFGLANVFATVCAGLLAALAAAAIGVWRARRSSHDQPGAGPRLLVTTAAVLAAVGVALAGGKGGYAAAGLGLLLVAIGNLPRVGRVARFGPVLGIGVVLVALAAVVLRGAVGERLSELSLLFRWFYMQGAVRIFAQHPLLGVGPDGFKDAYMLHKPPLSPEEVTSPHSVLLDYLATLGLAGIAWISLVFWMLARAGRSLLSSEGDAESWNHSAREVARFVGLTSAIAMLAAVYVERPVITPETMGLRVAGVVLATLLAVAMASVPRRAMRIVAAAGALAMVTHGQIEVTPVWIGSAGVVLVFLGIAGGGAPVIPGRFPRVRRIGSVVALAVPCAAVLWLAAPVWRWQRELGHAAAHVGVVTDLKQRLDAVAGRKPLFAGDTTELIASDASALSGGPAPASLQALRTTIAGLVAGHAIDCDQRFARALAHLRRAGLDSPDTARTRDRLWILIASIQKDMPEIRGPTDPDAMGRVRQIAADAAAPGQPDRGVSRLSAQASFARAAWALTGDRSLLKVSLDLFAEAAALDPYGLTYPLEAYHIARELGDGVQASYWARRCLELDTLTRLDPLRGLTEAQRREMTAIAG